MERHVTRGGEQRGYVQGTCGLIAGARKRCCDSIVWCGSCRTVLCIRSAGQTVAASATAATAAERRVKLHEC
jgi:hypothetical protein